MSGRRRDLSARVLLVAAVLTGIGGFPATARAWGFTAHRLVNARAVETLPEPLRAFYAANAAWVAEHSIDPDLARDRADDPDHFLDMDAFGAYPFPDIAEDEAAHLARFGADARSKGRVPWRIAEDYRKLVAAFRARDHAAILRHSADLGHLIADAHVPLHAALNHDGQLTNQKGLHSRWESALVERFQRQFAAVTLPSAAIPVRDPVAFTFAILRDSYLRSLEVLASDRAVAGPRDFAETPEDDRYDDAYYSRFYEREAARLSARLSASASAAGSLWASAWEEAGRPVPDASFRLPYVRGQARAVLLSLDGASAEVIDDAVRRGLMPRLAALRARGASARGAISALPTKTAPGHAALYTGAWGDGNGIVGNEVPVPGGSVLETQSGYSSTPLTAEPIWFAAARQDLDAVVVGATQVSPFSAYAENRFRGYAGRRLTLFDGYQTVDADDGVVTSLAWGPAGDTLSPLPAHRGDARRGELQVAGARIDGWIYDDPDDPAAGFDTLLLATDADPAAGIVLKPAAPSDDPAAFRSLTIPLAGGESGVFFRLHELAGDGSRLLLYHTSPHVIRSSKPRLEAAALEAAGGFVGNAAGYAYDDGKLGRQLWEGGDGTAEARYLESAGLVTRQFARLNAFAFDRTDWDLLLAYLPYPDEALHRWHGILDPSLPGHDPEVARRLRPYMDRLLAIVDAYVGQVEDKAGRDAIVAVATDHGMASAVRHFKPNVVLAEAGLLALDPAGRVDLPRTRAVYFPGGSGYVLINRQGRPGGTVPPGDEEDVRRRVAAALTAFEDPATGRPFGVRVVDVRAVRPSATGPTLGGPEAGDLFIEVPPRGVALSARTTGSALEPRRAEGTHFQDPADVRLHGAFVVAGPGVAAGADLGVIQLIDIAPTLCALMGMDPPAQAVGKPLAAALASKPVPAPVPARR